MSEKRIQAALANPQNMGEMAGADSVGTVGNSDCGEMLRLWVKFKDENGKKVIDRATFQSFGYSTAGGLTPATVGGAVALVYATRRRTKGGLPLEGAHR